MRVYIQASSRRKGLRFVTTFQARVSFALCFPDSWGADRNASTGCFHGRWTP